MKDNTRAHRTVVSTLHPIVHRCASRGAVPDSMLTTDVLPTPLSPTTRMRTDGNEAPAAALKGAAVVCLAMICDTHTHHLVLYSILR